MSAQQERVANGGPAADIGVRAIPSAMVLIEGLERSAFRLSFTTTGPAVEYSLPWVSPAERDRVQRAEVADRIALAERFAERVRDRDDVRDVIVAATQPDLLVAVIVDNAVMERDLELHAIFVDLARQSDDPSMGDLTVLVADKDELPKGKSLR